MNSHALKTSRIYLRVQNRLFKSRILPLFFIASRHPAATTDLHLDPACLKLNFTIALQTTVMFTQDN